MRIDRLNPRVVGKLGRSARLAIENLNIALAKGDWHSDLARIYLARAHEAQGEKKRAAEVLVSHSPLRSLHGGNLVGLDTLYNDIMKEIARL